MARTEELEATAVALKLRREEPRVVQRSPLVAIPHDDIGSVLSSPRIGSEARDRVGRVIVDRLRVDAPRGVDDPNLKTKRRAHDALRASTVQRWILR